MPKLNRLEPLVDAPVTMQNVMYISDESMESGETSSSSAPKKKKKSKKKAKKKAWSGY